ncbi:MAG TPA: family 10 glycosylhydrolase, partial [Opitutales bacterium]|nr:family 10 glycosylhydrolase [Opitutales bacterium]
VKVGISPFGIWKPGHPEGIQGTSQYDVLYADPKLWFNEGWLDYMTPQLYWPIDQAAQSYPRLLEWWASQNTKNRHLWPGNYTSRINNSNTSWEPSEIVNQIKLTRQQPGATGNVHFSMAPLMHNRRNINDALKAEVYSEPALVPATPWLDSSTPTQPRAALRRAPGNMLEIEWSSPEGENLRLWAVYTRTGGRDWKMQIVPAYKTTNPKLRIPADGITDVAISAVNRNGAESRRTLLRVR